MKHNRMHDENAARRRGNLSRRHFLRGGLLKSCPLVHGHLLAFDSFAAGGVRFRRDAPGRTPLDHVAV